MRNVIIVVLAFLLFACCEKKDVPSQDIGETFQSLPEMKDYEGNRYKIFIDTLPGPPEGSINIASGEIYYDDGLIWQSDSTYWINTYGKGELLFVVKLIASVGEFDSFLFYKGLDISSKARPEGFRSIAEVRSSGDYLYIAYSNYGSVRSHQPPTYAIFNLATEELE